MQPIARRNLMKGGAALTVAAAVPVAAKAAQREDAELRELWAQFLPQLRANDRAKAAVRKQRALFDAELPAKPLGVHPADHWHAHQWLWRKHGMDRLYAAWTREGNKLRRLVKAIRKAKAETLFGVGVKLAATEDDPEEIDSWDATIDLLDDLLACATEEEAQVKVNEWKTQQRRPEAQRGSAR
jgi:hypothetical protein